jgi:uncharacterized membrane protein
MQSKVRLFGHSLHQQLVAFPLGLLGASVAFDVIHIASDSIDAAMVAYWVLSAGLLSAFVAAPFGTIDWLSIPAGTRAKRIGALHGGGNLIVVALFALSWWLRWSDDSDALSAPALVLSLAGVALALLTAWLGGELVARLGVGVHDDANLDAPSSLDRDVPQRCGAVAAPARCTIFNIVATVIEPKVASVV